MLRIHLDKFYSLALPYSHHIEKIEILFENYPSKWKPVVFELHDFILAAHPNMQAWYKYKTAFYGINKNICYINARADQTALDVGFIQGNRIVEMKPEFRNYLHSFDLKTIRHYKIFENTWHFESMEVLNQILQFAILNSLSGHAR